MNKSQSVLILHGWKSSKEKWDRVKDILEKKDIKVIVPDLPGFKEETKIEKPWSLDDYLRWVETYVKKKEKEGLLKEPFFLVGHSFGGRIAIKFSVNNSEKVKGLILVSSAGIRNKKKYVSRLSSFKKFSFLPGFSFLRKIFYKFIVGKTDYLAVEGPMKETFKNIVSEDLTDLLPKIKNNTLIIWGERDDFTPISNGYLMREKINNSEMIKLKNIGHTPYLENPQLLADKIIDFIK
jgi:pimeloyl-ACP methyl ester carboxylesterase